MLNLNKIIILTGPTGIGKTEISIKIAQYITDIEIISADSMQVYRHMNIGTAKPVREILEKYRHYCIDLVDPSQDFDVMKYTSQAHKCLKDILSRNKKPIVVGGTGLYIKSLINPIFDGPGRDQNIRNQLTEIAREKGNSYLFKQLKKYDPIYSNKISPNDTKRIIRALEVFHLTGKPLSSFHQNDYYQSSKSDYNFHTICLYMNRNALYKRINHRVDKMIENGLIEETKRIFEKYDSINSNAMQGLGYKQMISYIQGNISREEAIEIIKKETRHFAKRQLSWFKNQIKVDSWISLNDNKEDKQQYVEKIINIMNKQGY